MTRLEKKMWHRWNNWRQLRGVFVVRDKPIQVMQAVNTPLSKLAQKRIAELGDDFIAFYKVHKSNLPKTRERRDDWRVVPGLLWHTMTNKEEGE